MGLGLVLIYSTIDGSRLGLFEYSNDMAVDIEHTLAFTLLRCKRNFTLVDKERVS